MKLDAQQSGAAMPTTQLATILAGLCRDSAPGTPPSTQDGGQSGAVVREENKRHDGAAGPPALTGGDITIGAILDQTRHAGFGFVAALLALVSVPLVGLTVPFGLAVAALGVQMVAGVPRPWMPGFIRRRLISAATLDSLSRRVDRWTAKATRVIRPRLTWLSTGPFWTLCGIGLTIQGLSLTLPIPGADWLFVIPIVLYGVALLECDGLLILACHVLTLIQVVVGVVLWQLIARGFMDVYGWCAGVLG